MKAIALTGVLMLLLCGVPAIAEEAREEMELQRSLEKDKAGKVNLTISREYANGSGSVTMLVSSGDEQFRLYSTKTEVWMWTEKKGIMMCVGDPEGGIKVFGQKSLKRPMPKAFEKLVEEAKKK